MRDSRLITPSSRSHRGICSHFSGRNRILSTAVAALLAAAPSVFAGTFTWVPTDAGPYNWNNEAGQNNWGAGAAFPNAAGDIANVGSNLSLNQTINLNVPITIGVLNIGDSDGDNPFTITAGTGGSFIFDNSGSPAQINQAASSSFNVIQANISTVGDLTIANNSPDLFNSLTLEGAIGSAATTGTQKISTTAGAIRFFGEISDGTTGGKIAIEQAGTGTTSLVGNNSFTGGVTLTSGTLALGSSTALGATASTFTVNGGTISTSDGASVLIENNNPQVWAGDFTFSSSALLDLGSGGVTLTGNRQISSDAGNLIVGGVISDGGSGFSLTKAGTGTLTLRNANTYGGATTVSAGTLAIQNAGALGTNNVVTVNSGGTLALEGDITMTGKALSLTGEGAGQGGALRSSGNNTWTGDITVNTSGITRVVSTFGLLTINGNIATSGTTANGFVLQGEGVINGVISGDASLTRSNNDAGTWTLNGVNTYTGITTISNGALRLGNANALQNTAVTLGANASNGLQFAPGIGTFNLVSLASSSGTSGIILEDSDFQPVTLSVGSAGTNTTFAGMLHGAGSLTKVGTGTLTLSNSSTFTGGVTVSAGIVQASDSATNVNNISVVRNGLGTGLVTLTNGTTLQLRANGRNDSTPQILVFGNNLKLDGAAATVNVDRQGGSGSGKTLTFGNLEIGEQTLFVTGGNSNSLRFDNATLTGNAIIDATANVQVGNIAESGGARSITKNGNGRLTVTGNAALTNGTTLNGGSVEVTGNLTGSVTVNGGTLQIGNGSYSGTLTGNVNNGSSVGFNRADASTYAGTISGVGSLTKSGSGTITLTGSNSYSGTTMVRNGTLLLDYTSSAAILNAATNLTLGAGTLYIKGASTGATAQTLGNFSTTASLTGKVVIDPNGGAGTTLTLGNTWTFGGSNGVHFDLSRGGTILSTPTQSNGVIVGSSGTVARATITGADGRTYFATVTGGAVAPQTALTTLASDTNSGTTNFNVSGHLVTSGAVRTGTLRIDTTTTAGSLDIAGGNLTYDRTAILMDGANDFEIKRSSGSGTVANVVIHQYGTGTLTLSAPIASGGGFTKTGPGLLVGMMESGAPGGVTITDGIYRVGVATAMPTNVTTIAGGILELGSGDLTAPLGNLAGQVRIIANGGFSAFGATRSVNIGGAETPATLAWDNSNFLPENSTFILSSDKSNATLDFRNSIQLGSLTRTVKVNNGSAEIDAQISGTLSGIGDLVKTGQGTLALTGANTFSGATIIQEGTVVVNGSLSGSVNASAGTLQGGGDGVSTGVIAGNIVMGDNLGSTDAILSPGNGLGLLVTTGSLSLNSDAQFKFELNSGLGATEQRADAMFANGITLAAGATFIASDLGSGTLNLGTTFTVLNNTSFDPIGGFFSNLANGAIFTLNGNAFQASYAGGDGNDLVLTVVPEPSTFVTLLAGVGALLGMQRRRFRSRVR